MGKGSGNPNMEWNAVFFCKPLKSDTALVSHSVAFCFPWQGQSWSLVEIMAACEYIINATFGIGLGAWGATSGSLLEIKPLSPWLPGTSEAAVYFGWSRLWVGGLLFLWRGGGRVSLGGAVLTGCQVGTLLRRVCPRCSGVQGFQGLFALVLGPAVLTAHWGGSSTTWGMLHHDSPSTVLHFAAAFFIMFIKSNHFPVDQVPRCNCSTNSLSKHI